MSVLSNISDSSSRAVSWTRHDTPSPPLHAAGQRAGGEGGFCSPPPTPAGLKASPFLASFPPPLNLSLLCPGRLHVRLQVERFMKDVVGFPPYRKLFVCVCVCTLMGGSRGIPGEKEERQTEDPLTQQTLADVNAHKRNFIKLSADLTSGREQWAFLQRGEILFILLLHTYIFAVKVSKSLTRTPVVS